MGVSCRRVTDLRHRLDARTLHRGLIAEAVAETARLEVTREKDLVDAPHIVTG